MPTHDQPVLYSADLTDCDSTSLLSPEGVESVFAAVLGRAGATVVNSVAHVFPGAALTCVLILAESHATLHTWPETGTVNIDIFCCSTRVNGLAAIHELARAFGAANVTVQEIPRADGRRQPVHAG